MGLLRLKPGKRPDKKKQIAEAAVTLLINDGYSALSLQRVADESGISLGNLTYHFPTREKLIDAVVDSLINEYQLHFESMAAKLVGSREQKLHDLVEWVLDDAVNPRTARVCTELWAIANQNDRFAASVNRLYDETIIAFAGALGLNADSGFSGTFKHHLYFLAVITEGTSAVFGRRQKEASNYPEFLMTKQLTRELLVPRLQSELKRL